MGILDQSELVEKPQSSRGGKSKTMLSMLGVILLLAVVAGGSIYVVKMKPELLGLTKSAAVSAEETEDLVKKVSKIIQLPNGEMPTVATVSDLSKVKSQEFFRNAEEGDRVLVYKDAKRAFLYRPGENRIIEVGVVNVNNEPQSGEVAGEKTEIPVVSITPLPTQVPVSITPSVTLKPTVQPTATTVPSSTSSVNQ